MKFKYYLLLLTISFSLSSCVAFSEEELPSVVFPSAWLEEQATSQTLSQEETLDFSSEIFTDEHTHSTEFSIEDSIEESCSEFTYESSSQETSELQTTTVPQPTTTTPQPTTTVPQPTTTAPQPTTTVPQPTTTAPQPTTTAPQSTTTAPQPTTTAPQPTTTAPQPTTTAPQPTTQDPNTPTVVSYIPELMNGGTTYTNLLALPATEYIVTDPQNTRGLSTQKHAFSFGVAQNETASATTVNNQNYFDALQMNALAWDNKTTNKVLYLTFDNGYEYKNHTSMILDTLAEKNVPAAFFCTLSYLKTSPNTVARMIAEGHLVGNHTNTHPDCSTLSRAEMALELLSVHNHLRVNFGYNCRYFRFPSGSYSENILDLVNSQSYRSIFWSIAYTDWDPDNQLGEDVALQTLIDRLHPGAVILLHTTSPDNVAILDEFIDYAKAQGYEFHSLDQYTHWK